VRRNSISDISNENFRSTEPDQSCSEANRFHDCRHNSRGQHQYHQNHHHHHHHHHHHTRYANQNNHQQTKGSFLKEQPQSIWETKLDGVTESDKDSEIDSKPVPIIVEKQKICGCNDQSRNKLIDSTSNNNISRLNSSKSFSNNNFSKTFNLKNSPSHNQFCSKQSQSSRTENTNRHCKNCGAKAPAKLSNSYSFSGKKESPVSLIVLFILFSLFISDERDIKLVYYNLSFFLRS
jgi:hypothetical protein